MIRRDAGFEACNQAGLEFQNREMRRILDQLAHWSRAMRVYPVGSTQPTEFDKGYDLARDYVVMVMANYQPGDCKTEVTT
jgi:hypothetical protein